MKELKKCIFNSPYVMTRVIVLAKAATKTDPAVPKHNVQETYKLTLPENRAYINAEAVKFIPHLMHAKHIKKCRQPLNDCSKFTSRDGESTESYYSRFYKMMKEMVRNQLEVGTMQVNVQFLQQLQPEWSRFVTIVKQTIDLDKESYHKIFDILKQYQNEVNEIRAEKIARNANPRALVAATQQYPSDNYYHAPKPHKNQTTSSRHTSSTSSHALTRTKDKEIAKPRTPPSLSASEDDSDPEQAQRDKDTQKSIALISKYFTNIYKPTNNNLRTSSNSRNKNVDSTPRTGNDRQTRQFRNQRTVKVVGDRETIGKQTRIQCFYCQEYGDFAKECRKPKRVKDYSYHKEKIMLCKQEEKGVPLSAEQSDWLHDTDEEPDEQELEAHYIQHSEHPESINDTYVMETVDSNVIPDHSDMCNNEVEDDQNVDDNDENERVELANLIANLKLDIDENKKIQKQLRKANRTLTRELNESKSALTESNDIRDRCRSALHQKDVELEKYITYKNCQLEKEEIERKYKETLDLLAHQKHQSHEALKT
ncbi:putative reverse transcriptase domain, ribonuclease H-like domain protein [Tanacetum coccineum]